MLPQGHQLGLLFMLFGGILLLGRDFFGGSAGVVGSVALVVVVAGFLVGLAGVASDAGD